MSSVAGFKPKFHLLRYVTTRQARRVVRVVTWRVVTWAVLVPMWRTTKKQ